MNKTSDDDDDSVEGNALTKDVDEKEKLIQIAHPKQERCSCDGNNGSSFDFRRKAKVFFGSMMPFAHKCSIAPFALLRFGKPNAHELQLELLRFLCFVDSAPCRRAVACANFEARFLL